VADNSSIPFDNDDGNPTSNSDDSDARGATGPTGETPQDQGPEAAPEDPHEGAVPPGYDWPTHGGYLGCLIGLIASCLIGGFLGSTLFPALGYSNAVPKGVAAVLTVVVFLGITVGLGRLGWILGKRFYREYPQAGRGNLEPARHEERNSTHEHGAQASDSGAVDVSIDSR
jgi:hypothetical protein